MCQGTSTNFAQTANARISIGLGPGLMAVTVHLSGSLVGSAKSRCVGLIRFPPLVISDPPPVTTSSEAQIALVDLVDPSPAT